jgi:hypothetical protein
MKREGGKYMRRKRQDSMTGKRKVESEERRKARR